LLNMKEVRTKMEEIKTVRLKESTHQRLGRAGYMNQTYDDVINELLDIKEKYEFMNQKVE